jgi:hypothetical protein
MSFQLINGKWVQNGQAGPPNPNLQQLLTVPPLDLDSLYNKYNTDIAKWRKDNGKSAT